MRREGAFEPRTAKWSWDVSIKQPAEVCSTMSINGTVLGTRANKAYLGSNANTSPKRSPPLISWNKTTHEYKEWPRTRTNHNNNEFFSSNPIGVQLALGGVWRHRPA